MSREPSTPSHLRLHKHDSTGGKVDACNLSRREMGTRARRFRVLRARASSVRCARPSAWPSRNGGDSAVSLGDRARPRRPQGRRDARQFGGIARRAAAGARVGRGCEESEGRGSSGRRVRNAVALDMGHDVGSASANQRANEMLRARREHGEARRGRYPAAGESARSRRNRRHGGRSR